MRKPFFSIAAFGFFVTLALSGCPWSNSPNVFEGAKGISMPSFGGPPAQSEPALADEAFSDSPSQTDDE